jgi:hypothetical protein
VNRICPAKPCPDCFTAETEECSYVLIFAVPDSSDSSDFTLLNILGIHIGHDSSAALVVDGKIVAVLPKNAYA